MNFCDAVYSIKTAIETLKITGDPQKLAQERKTIDHFLYNSPELQGLQFKYRNVNGEKVAPRSYRYLCGQSKGSRHWFLRGFGDLFFQHVLRTARRFPLLFFISNATKSKTRINRLPPCSRIKCDVTFVTLSVDGTRLS